MVQTYKQKFNKKHGFKKNESHSVCDIAKKSKISCKGRGAFYSSPKSVRPNVKSATQWGIARLYASVYPGSKSSKIDAKELKKGRKEYLSRKK